MLGKVCRSRPIQLAFITGLSIYALLTIVALLLKNSDTWVVTQQGKRSEQASDISQWYHKQEKVAQGEKLDEILAMLKHIKPEGAGGDTSRQQAQDLATSLQSGDNKKPNNGDVISPPDHVVSKSTGVKRTSVNLKTVLENPAGEPPSPSIKKPLDEIEYMPQPHYHKSACPKTLSSITKYSKWFRQHYRPGVKVFMDQDDINQFDNYYKLAHYSLPFGFMRENRTLMGEILNHVNFTNSPLNRPSGQCVRCAVVGCGGILNGSNAGEEIDSHDYVFRLNRAISKDRHAQDVGKKTSFYTFFPESMHIKDVEDPNAEYIYTAFKKYDLNYALNMLHGDPPPPYVSKGKKYKLSSPGIDPGRLKMVHPDFFRYVFTHYLEAKGSRPTTGALVVFLAVHLCDEVTIYGFGYDTRFTLHYYDSKFVNHTSKSTSLHDIDNERELWMKLHEEGVIRLFKRDL